MNRNLFEIFCFVSCKDIKLYNYTIDVKFSVCYPSNNNNNNNNNDRLTVFDPGQPG